MKEDILEQLIEDWYVNKPGWFVKHNVRYRPNKNHKNYNSNQDAVHSDIDIIAYSAKSKKTENVHVISCKSWQGGVKLKWLYDVIESEPDYSKRAHNDWKKFRELISDKWIAAFIDKIEEETGQRDFVYKIAVTKSIADKKIDYLELIQNNTKIKQRFKKNHSNIQIEIIDLNQIVSETITRLKDKETPAVEMTEIGRFIQLLNAAEIDIKF